MKRLECLDGLRGMLAAYVLLCHMAPFAAAPGWLIGVLSHGQAMVDVFFILSGLVITQSLDSFERQSRGFFIARLARIYPVYLPMFALSLAVQALPTDFAAFPWIAPDSVACDIWSNGWPRHWLADIALHLTMTHGLLPQGILPDVWISILPSAWSLSTEWQFYALVLGLSLLLPKHRLALFFLCIGAAAWLWHNIAAPEWLFSRAFLPNKAQYFALGIVSLAVMRDQAGALRNYLAVLATALLLCFLQGGASKLIAPLFWSLCLAAQLHPHAISIGWLSLILRHPMLQRLGAWSYSLYLANEPVQKPLALALARVVHGDAVWFNLLWIPTSIALPLLLAAWLHTKIEVPALRYGRTKAREAAAELQKRAALEAVIDRG